MSFLRISKGLRKKTREPSDSSSPEQNQADFFPGGIKILHDCPKAVVDICFVHGLTGDRESTWTAGKGLGPWPQTLLPSHLPRARIFTYGYDAYIMRSSVASSNRLIDHATNLLNDFAIERAKEAESTGRPIIFVVHSLGGIVCKEALLLSRNSPEADLKAIFSCTKGIVFMGTPHTGSWTADWAKIPANTLGVVKSINKSLLEILETDNQFLESIHRGFLETLRDLHARNERFEITCFFEELPIPVAGLVVSKASATFPGYNVISIHADHHRMVKFATSEENGFKRVVGVLTRWVNDIIREGNSSSSFSGQSEQKKYISFPGFDADELNFIKRNEMAEIDKQFQSVEQGQGSMTLVLYGMGGCGKSQLALSYCRKAQQSPRYSGVLWIDGTSLATVKESFVEAAQEMELMNWESIDHQTAMKGIFHLVGKSKTPWIVVFDNHDDLKAYDLHDFLPKHRAESRLTIITSRSTETRQLGHAIKIGNLSEDEGLSLLLGKYITTPSNSNMTQGRLVIQRLGHLALAISQASAFILERNMDLNSFLSEYENEKERIHASLPALWRYERRGSQEDQNRFPLSIATTWELSLNLVSASGSTAFKDAKVQLLITSAFFGKTVTEDLFREYLRSTPSLQLPAWMGFFTRPATQELDTYVFREAITEMGRLCLLQSHQIDAHGVTWQFHPVVQDWAQNRQGHDTFETLALLALKILQCSLEDYENGSVLEPNYSGKTYQGLRPHVEACYQNCKKIFLEKRPGSSLVEQGLTCAMNRMANFFSFDGRYDVAKELQRKLVDVSTQGSPEHKWALRQLANTLIRDRQLLEAAKLQEEAVRAQADEDVEYAFQLLELSMTYRHQALNPRQFPDARKSIQDSLDLGFKALDILWKLKGDTSLEVASALADLAITEYHAGNLDRARELGENALSIKATILGAESSTTLDAKNSLAVTIAKQGNCDTAARMHEEVRDIRLSAVGPCHPDTMRTELWLARAWRLGGHVKKARALNEELLQKSLGQFGHYHPDTQSAAMGLWRCLITQGLIQEADRVQREYGLLLKTVEEKMREEALAIHG